MRIHRKVSEGTLTVSVSGVLRASPRSIEFFQQLISSISEGVRRVELDLQQVLFIDSLWLGFLATLSAQCRERGVALKVPAISRQLLRALDEAHMAQVLPTNGGKGASGSGRK